MKYQQNNRIGEGMSNINREIADLLGEDIRVVNEALDSEIIIGDITTIDKAAEAYTLAPSRSKAEKLAIERWISLCTTIDEIKEVYYATPASSEFERLAIEKWINLCATITEVQEVYDVASDRGEVERLAIEKWVSFCTTIDEIKEVYDATHDRSPFEYLVLEKLNELSLVAINNITTIAEATGAYSLVPNESEVRKLIIRKIAELLKQKA